MAMEDDYYKVLKERAIRDGLLPPTPPPGVEPDVVDLKSKVWLRDAHIDALKYELATQRAKRVDAERRAANTGAVDAQATYDAQKAYEAGIKIGTRRLHRQLRTAVQELARASNRMATAMAALPDGQLD